MNIEKIVLDVHTKLMGEEGIYKVSNKEMRVGRECGIDSLGIVTMVLEIEERLGVDLDSCLADIRRARTIDDIIKVVEEKCNEKNTTYKIN